MAKNPALWYNYSMSDENKTQLEIEEENLFLASGLLGEVDYTEKWPMGHYIEMEEGTDPRSLRCIMSPGKLWWVCLTVDGAVTRLNKLVELKPGTPFKIMTLAEALTEIAMSGFNRGYVAGLAATDESLLEEGDDE